MSRAPRPERPPAEACPCGSGRAYAACCGRFHGGAQHLQAPDPEALMRSRYCAYVKGLRDYIADTWHPSTRPASIDPDPPGLQWLRLEVKATTIADADHASVEFVAVSRLGGRAQRLHETSRFVREAGRWFYLAGDWSVG
jgi:SEC-C motif-containing protein